jgi:hypothetical protein
MKRTWLFLVALSAATIANGPAFGRGFGGFHGGAGFGGGGFGGGFGGGGHVGGFGGGGFGGGGGAGGFHGGFDGRGFQGGGFQGGYGSGGFNRGFGGGFGNDPGRFGGETGRFGEGLGGGFQPGQLEAASRQPSGFGGEGFRGGQTFGDGGFRPGSLEGLSRGEFGGAAPSAGRLNSFLGLPTDGGLSAAGGRDFGARYSGDAHGLSSYGAAAGERGGSGTVVKGPDGGTIAHGEAGARGVVAGPGGVAGGARAASGTVIKGPGDGVYAHGDVAGRGFYADTRGVGTWRAPAADMRLQGNYVRSNFHDYGAFRGDWWHAHPAAWWAAGYRAGLWSAANWDDVDDWFGVAWPPIGYAYGNDVTYNNNNVYLYGEPIATSAEYYQSAADLAQTGEQANIPSAPPPQNDQQAALADAADAKWLPLGVYQAIPGGQKSSTMTFQLAVNKDGIVRGNYFNSSDNNVQQVQGAVDKKTQRISWVVVDRKKIVFDTGLYNLTKDESTMLVHEGADKTQQWTLVRLKQPDEDTSNQ